MLLAAAAFWTTRNAPDMDEQVDLEGQQDSIAAAFLSLARPEERTTLKYGGTTRCEHGKPNDFHFNHETQTILL
jgi:hypothetical protein